MGASRERAELTTPERRRGVPGRRAFDRAGVFRPGLTAGGILFNTNADHVSRQLELSQEDAAGMGLIAGLDAERHAAVSNAGTGSGSYHSTTPPSIARSLSSPDELMESASPPPPPSDHLAAGRRPSGEKHALSHAARSGMRSANRMQVIESASF